MLITLLRLEFVVLVLYSKYRGTVSAMFQNKVILSYNVAAALKIAYNVTNLKSPVLKMLAGTAQSV